MDRDRMTCNRDRTEAADHYVVKKVTAGEGRDSLCTWRDRCAGSCAADPEASQNDLSVGKRKDSTKVVKMARRTRPE